MCTFFKVGSRSWAVRDSNIISWIGVRSGIQGTKACGFIFKPMCYAVISRKKKKTHCFFYKRSFIYLFIYIIIVIYAFNLNYFVSFCGFYVFYVSFLNVNSSIGKHFRTTFVVFLILCAI